MNDEQILKGRLTDLAKRAYSQNIYTYSNFLSPAELALFEDIRSEVSYIRCETFGGNELCERQVIGFGSEEEFGYPGEFPIAVIKVTPLLAKFSDDLNHRDFLGALMHLGIERDTLGDILIKDNTAYIFCLERIAGYICDELTKVKHTNVKCEKNKHRYSRAYSNLRGCGISCCFFALRWYYRKSTKMFQERSTLIF